MTQKPKLGLFGNLLDLNTGLSVPCSCSALPGISQPERSKAPICLAASLLATSSSVMVSLAVRDGPAFLFQYRSNVRSRCPSIATTRSLLQFGVSGSRRLFRHAFASSISSRTVSCSLA